MSLALNSREAMPDGGTLRIEASNAVMRDADGPSARAVRLTVTDTGRGMAPRGDRARVRAVLHHQGRVRPRRRPRPGDRLRDRHPGARARSS